MRPAVLAELCIAPDPILLRAMAGWLVVNVLP